MTDASLPFPSDTSLSKALFERAQNSLPGGNTRTTVAMQPYQLYAAHGEGCRVVDVDGVSRIDCINNFTAAIHGHAHPALLAAAVEQLRLGSAFGLATESEIALAERLCARVPSVERCRFANSGTEAVMHAIKAARAFTGRPKIAKCEGAYHGSYDYAEVSLDPDRDSFSANVPRAIPYARGTPAGVTDDVLVIPFNDTDAAAALIRAHAGSLAAILLDAMPNRAGLVPAEPGFLAMLRELADETGALLILDEVITFRLGRGGAQQILGIDPDLSTFGKIIGGGFPVGAIGGRADIMAVFDPTHGKPALPQGGTFSANPVTMRCGAAALDLLDEATFAHLDGLGEFVRAGRDAAFRKAGLPGHTTGMGSLLRVHCTAGPVRDYRSAMPDALAARRMAALMRGLLNAGVLMAPNGLMALSTPMTDDDAAVIIAAFGAVLTDIAR
jgi:glutamate-1-semialdehyde 2,1-aminomutase